MPLLEEHLVGPHNAYIIFESPSYYLVINWIFESPVIWIPTIIIRLDKYSNQNNSSIFYLFNFNFKKQKIYSYQSIKKNRYPENPKLVSDAQLYNFRCYFILKVCRAKRRKICLLFKCHLINLCYSTVTCVR